jgi:NAD(P)-dependent dehydrogenase (short-subunit alcohol dehydrogenase family)
MPTNWSLDMIPDLAGKTAIITGGNVGLGFKSALELSRKGVEVVIACRSAEKGEEAIARIKAELPSARLQVITLDLLDRDSIRHFADQFQHHHARLHILMNNAGVVNLPELHRTSEGWEMHMATNHLGHFALTGMLAPMLLATEKARVVTLSSGAYRSGTVDFEDFHWQKRPYSRMSAYGDSKLANLVFAHQLQRYFEQAGVDALSVSAHPGLTATERQQSIGIGGRLARWMASPVAKGCRSQLLAATATDIQAGDFWGPKFGIWGPPSRISLKPGTVTDSLAQKLWDHSAELTGISYPRAVF